MGRNVCIRGSHRPVNVAETEQMKFLEIPVQTDHVHHQATIVMYVQLIGSH
jgi:hypothetical protein